MPQSPEIRSAMHAAYTAAAGFMKDRAVIASLGAADYRVQWGHGGRHEIEAEIAEQFASEFAAWAALKAPTGITP